MEFEVAGRVCHPEIGEELLIPAGAVLSARNIGATTAPFLRCRDSVPIWTLPWRARALD
jgi:hypothetical protein